jgi:XapX domain-containing protein
MQGEAIMSYAISLVAGLVVGLLYYFARVQSPAPPLVALVGLLGIVIGEHAIPVVQAQFLAPSVRAESAASPGSAANTSAPKQADDAQHQ